MLNPIVIPGPGHLRVRTKAGAVVDVNADNPAETRDTAILVPLQQLTEITELLSRICDQLTIITDFPLTFGERLAP